MIFKAISIFLLCVSFFQCPVYSCEMDGPDYSGVRLFSDIEGKSEIAKPDTKDYYEVFFYRDHNGIEKADHKIFYHYADGLLVQKSWLNENKETGDNERYEYASSGIQLSKKYYRGDGTLAQNEDGRVSIVLYLYNLTPYLAARVAFDNEHAVNNVATLEIVSNLSDRPSFIRKNEYWFKNNAMYNCYFTEYSFPESVTLFFHSEDSMYFPFKIKKSNFEYENVVKMQKTGNTTVKFIDAPVIEKQNASMNIGYGKKYSGERFRDFGHFNNIEYGGIRFKEVYTDGKITEMYLVSMNNKPVELNGISYITWQYHDSDVIERQFDIAGEMILERTIKTTNKEELKYKKGIFGPVMHSDLIKYELTDLLDECVNYLRNGHPKRDDVYEKINRISTHSLRALKNLPFALRGYKFNSADLLALFKQYDWYVPASNNPAKDSLNQKEKEFFDYVAGREKISAAREELGKGGPIKTIQGDASCMAVAFSPDSRYIASGSRNAYVRIWQVKDGILLRSMKENANRTAACVAYSPDGKLLASGGDGKEITIWSASDGTMLRSMRESSNWVSSVAFSPDSKYLALGSHSRTINLWRVSDGVCIRTLSGHNGFVRSVAFSPDGELLASAGADKSVKIWRVSDGALIHTIEGQEGSVNSVMFSPDGRYLAAACDSRDGVKIWNVSDWTLFHAFGIYQESPSLQFSSDGKYLASTTMGAITIWRFPECVLDKKLFIHFAYGSPFSFSPDNTYIAGVDDKGLINLWSLQ